MYISKQQLAASLNGIKNRKSKILKYLESFGDHRLIYRIKKDRIYYSDKSGLKEVGISNNIDRIHSLMMKEYLREQLKILEANEMAIEQCLKKYEDIYVENIIDILVKRYPGTPVNDILKYYDTDWGKQHYEKNPFYSEDYKYLTTNGVLVRSKSEREIANSLEAANLQYQSDVLIECGDEHYYADFLILRPDKTKVIWEHFGREHDKIYMAKSSQRIKDYISIGYRPWNDLIWTLESDLKDSNTIRKIIDRFLLCEMNSGFSR